MAEETPSPNAPENTPETPEETPQSFTQDDMNKVAGQRAKEAEERYRRKILEAAGYDSEDALLEAAREQREAQELTKTELEKRDERIKELESAQQTAIEQANQRVINSELRAALTSAGLNAERLPLALRVADTDSLEVGDDGTVSGLQEVVQSLQEASPEWFGQQDRPPRRSPDAGVRQSVSEDVTPGMGRLLKAYGP